MIKRKVVTAVVSAVSLLVAVGMSAFAQSLPTGTPVLDDYYRRAQLLGRFDSAVSFTIRPLTARVINEANIFRPEGGGRVSPLWRSGDRAEIQLLPVQWKHQINSAFPYGWNDGAMIPSAGYQTMLSGGVYARFGRVSIQLRPEYVLAQNRRYETFDSPSRQAWSAWYSRWGNSIDRPERFGDGWYSKFLPGQSSIRVDLNPISVGVSTENLWWGPGLHYSLLMTNTAPGFAHLTLNTTRPIRTPIGHFEGQLVAGRLEGSGFPPKEMGNPNHHEDLYRPKLDDWRYLSGLVLTYQPKWLSGLAIGFSRAFMAYNQDLRGKFRNYLPFFEPVLKTSYGGEGDSALNEGEGFARDQLFSAFVRWVIPAAQAEAYFEYGRNDHPWDMRDLFVMLEHSRAYVFGFRKLTAVNWFGDDFLSVNLEILQSEGPTEDIRRGGPWYRHGQVRHGYTHLGQMLGAGVDPGSNVQTLNIAWVQGLRQLGLQYQRYVHYNDLFYRISDDMRRNWVDMSLALFGEWDYRQFLLTGQLQFTKAYNYNYQEVTPSPTNGTYWQFEGHDKFNVLFQVGMSYRF